jgi:site-specific recombinase XerD
MQSDFDIILGDSQVANSSSNIVPAVIASAGPRARPRFIEFFTANIANANTRAAYFRATRRFTSWCQAHELSITTVQSPHIAQYREELLNAYSAPSVKQHLAAIRMLFDYFTTGGILEFNPAAAVRGPRVVVSKGKTPVLSAESARNLLDTIDISKIAGVRDRALIGLMLYSFARIGAAVAMNVDDVYRNGHRYWVRLHEKGGKFHEMPLHHNAEDYLVAYLDAAGMSEGKRTPLFRTLDRKRCLTVSRMRREDAWRMMRRRALQAGVGPICNHTCRATGITVYMENGGTLERAQRMAGHASARTTSLYDRSSDRVTLDEVERVII